MPEIDPLEIDPLEIAEALAARFEPSEVKAKPQIVNGGRALAMFYVDARVVMDRLDEVLGVDGWQDDYELTEGGCVICRLRVLAGDEWVMKVDVGEPSKQPDVGDRMKAAFSDALKRAAVKFGVGRYLYRTPAVWVDYDPQKKQFVKAPQIPGEKPRGPDPTPRPSAASGAATNTQAAPKTAAAEAAPKKADWDAPVPTDGTGLSAWVATMGAALAAESLCQVGAIRDFLYAAARKSGENRLMNLWGPDTVTRAVAAGNRFIASVKAGNKPTVQS